MRTISAWFIGMGGPGQEPLKPQQSIVFQGAVFRFTGSAMSRNTFTPLSIVSGRFLTSGVITGTRVEALGRPDASGRSLPSSRDASPSPAAAVIAVCINVRREPIVPLCHALL